MNALAPYMPLARDPSSLTWSPTMLIELALRTAPPDAIRQEYGYTEEQWDALPHNPAFLKGLSEAVELVQQEGMSFKLKARMLAEEFLPNVYKMVTAQPEAGISASVKADLIKFITRVAGYDQKQAENQGAVQANTFNLQINLGNDV